MYGHDYYGRFPYGENPKTDVIPEDITIFLPDLMKFLPKYYQNSYITRGIQESIAMELGRLGYTNKDNKDQIFIERATWGLVFYEYVLGIPVNPDLTEEQRRDVIKGKIRGRGTTTKAMIINTAESFTGGEVEVTEYPEKYHFTIKFIGKRGIPSNLDVFRRQIDDIKPAHLSYKLIFTLNTYGMITNQLKVTWEEANKNNITWGDIQEYRIDEVEEI